MKDPKLEKMSSRSQPEEENIAPEPRRGLSINDTIAADANLSVGSHGVDTSGVRAGSGAGAGSTMLTPGSRGESPAPNIIPGARSTGTTPRGASALTANPDAGPDLSPELSREEIMARAYRCWHERGCPEGSPDVDWTRAEQELQTERQRKSAAAASR